MSSQVAINSATFVVQNYQLNEDVHICREIHCGVQE